MGNGMGTISRARRTSQKFMLPKRARGRVFKRVRERSTEAEASMLLTGDKRYRYWVGIAGPVGVTLELLPTTLLFPPL